MGKITCELKHIRRKKKKTQGELAKNINVKQTTISEWENENAIPNLKKAYELAKYLKVEVTDIWK